MRYWGPKRVEPSKYALDGLDIRQRVAEQGPISLDDFPQLAKVGVVEQVRRTRRYATLYLFRPVLSGIVTYHLRHKFHPPSGRFLLHQSRTDQIADRKLKAIEKFIVLRHECGIVPNPLRNLRIICIACALAAWRTKLDFLFPSHTPQVIVEGDVVEPKILDRVLHPTPSKGSLLGS